MPITRLMAVAAMCLPLLAACTDNSSGPDRTDGPPLPEPSGRVIVPTGTVVEVRMATDEKGNYFDPALIEARPGDVLRLVLVSGVHNFSIPADRNPGRTGLPGPTDFFYAAGQTLDVPVNLPAGDYAFQCDPHAALGMVGRLRVR